MVDAKTPAIERTRENDVASLGREVHVGVVGVLDGPIAIGFERLAHDAFRPEGAGDGVDLLEDVVELLVGLGGTKFQLGDEPVDLIQHETRMHVLRLGLTKHRLCLNANAFDDVDDDNRAVGNSHRCGHLS